jgi:ribosomal protein L44E
VSGYADRVTGEPIEQPTPRTWLRLIESDDADPLEVLRTVGTYQRYLAAIEERAVMTARRMGRSWEEVAEAIGVKRQSAWAKYQHKVHSAADVVFAGRRIRPRNIRLRCPGCGEERVFKLQWREDPVVIVEAGEAEFRLPGDVRWTCASCGRDHERRIELPPFFDAA